MLNFYERILNYIFNHYGKYLSDKTLVSIRYRIIFHKPLRIRKPETFYEKIQWLKLHDHNPEYHIMADKYAARKFVEEKIGSRYLIPLLGVWEKAEEIDFSMLPSQFVLKCTHDSQSIVICHDKNTLDVEKVRARLDAALKTDYFSLGREWAYQGIKPLITAEKLLTDESGKDLKDYKVFCFNGVPRFIQIDYDRFVDHKRRFYTTDWEKMDVKISYEDDQNMIMEKPVLLQELLDISGKLAEGTPFLRVDCYIAEGRIYFGELTFYPGCGFEPISPYSYDEEWGRWLMLPELEKKGRKL